MIARTASGLAGLIGLIGLAACGGPAATEAPADDFLRALTGLCGQAFEGRIVDNEPAPDADPFADQRLVMHVRECADGVVRVPFHVGDDRSRTWVITRTAQGLRLKHDHRHADGMPDVVTMYGGETASIGTPVRQEFPADADSRALFEREGLAASIANTWAMELEPGRRFVYELTRPNRTFRVEFDLTTPVAAPPPPWGVSELWSDLSGGPYDVGVRDVHLPAGADGPAAPITLWYPAAGATPDSAPPVTFERYFIADLVPRLETDDAAAVRRALAGDMTGDPDGIDANRSGAILRTPMRAAEGLAPAAGRMPVVLWSPRHGTPAGQSVLNEYLASHGYAVVSVRPDAAWGPFPWESDADDGRASTIEGHVAVMRRAAAWIGTEPGLDPARLAVMAWSYGGESAGRFVAGRSDVAVVVGLSANILSGWAYAPDAMSSMLASGLPASVVLLSEERTRPAPDGVLLQRPDAFGAGGRAGYWIRFPALRHGVFNVVEGLAPAAFGITAVHPWSLAGRDAATGYAAIACVSRQALEAHLVPEPAADAPARMRRATTACGLDPDVATLAFPG